MQNVAQKQLLMRMAAGEKTKYDVVEKWAIAGKMAEVELFLRLVTEKTWQARFLRKSLRLSITVSCTVASRKTHHLNGRITGFGQRSRS